MDTQKKITTNQIRKFLDDNRICHYLRDDKSFYIPMPNNGLQDGRIQFVLNRSGVLVYEMGKSRIPQQKEYHIRVYSDAIIIMKW